MTGVTSTTVSPSRDASAAGGDVPVVLDGATVFYGEVIGLSRVDLTLVPGITGIVGPNGSGKTTLMRGLVGLIAPQEGSIRVLGGSPFRDAEIRSRITFVPATENFFPGLSGRRNLEVAFLAHGADRGRAASLADEALEVVGLTADGHRRYGTWSRGMRQRLKLGLALVSSSTLVLLDEPFLGVDPPNRKALREHILALGAAGRTVLVSSHILHEIETLTDRVGVLAHGRLLGFGHIHDLLHQIRDRNPHRVRVGTPAPREFAKSLVSLEHVRTLAIDHDAVEFVTDQPDSAYKEIGRIVLQSGIRVHRVETLDASLEAVFTHVTEGGTRRL